jgi:predicted PurR-regulated permease PerM
MAQPIKPTSPPWQPGTRLVAGVIILIFLSWLFYSVRQLATPLILALFLAYLLHPLVTKLVVVSRMPRWLAVVIFYIILLILMMGATTGIGLAISQQITGVIDDLGTLADEIPIRLQEIQTQVIQIGPWELDLNQLNIGPLIDQLSSTLQPILMGTGTILASLAGSAASAVGVVILALVMGFYLLLDFGKIKGAILDLIPDSHDDDVSALIENTGKIWQAFLRGQLLLGVVIGSIVSIALSIIGMRFALGLGLIAGIFEFVPVFGPVISGLIAGTVALFQSSNWLGLSPLGFAILVLIIFFVIQQVENNVLVPRIIGHSLNLHPLIVLIAALAGGILGGVLGILLAAPFVATLRIWLGYIYRKIVGLGSEPDPVLVPPPRREMPQLFQRVRNWFRRPITKVKDKDES